jgi:hypothetical protein
MTSQATPDELAELVLIKKEAKKEKNRLRNMAKAERGLPKAARKAEKAAKTARKAAAQEARAAKLAMQLKAKTDRDEAARILEQEAAVAQEKEEQEKLAKILKNERKAKKAARKAKKAAKVLIEKKAIEAHERKLLDVAVTKAFALQERKDRRKARRDARKKIQDLIENDQDYVKGGATPGQGSSPRGAPSSTQDVPMIPDTNPIDTDRDTPMMEEHPVSEGYQEEPMNMEVTVERASEDKWVSVITIYLVPPSCHYFILHVLYSCPCHHFRPTNQSQVKMN